MVTVKPVSIWYNNANNTFFVKDFFFGSRKMMQVSGHLGLATDSGQTFLNYLEEQSGRR